MEHLVTIENVFQIAEQFVDQLEPQVGSEALEKIIGVLVLMCVGKQTDQGGNSVDNINFMLEDSSFRLVPTQ